MSPGWRNLAAPQPFCMACRRRTAAARHARRVYEVNNLKKVAAVAAIAGGLAAVGAGAASADSSAHGAAVASPGVASGNLVQAPVHVPVNMVGNTVDVIGLLNPAFGNNGLNH
jgi:ChpA-C